MAGDDGVWAAIHGMMDRSPWLRTPPGRRKIQALFLSLVVAGLAPFWARMSGDSPVVAAFVAGIPAALSIGLVWWLALSPRSAIRFIKRLVSPAGLFVIAGLILLIFLVWSAVMIAAGALDDGP